MTEPKQRPPAVACLTGLRLANGWEVVRHLPRPDNLTGGCFSTAYIAKNGNEEGFLKAFDFSRAFEAEDSLLALQMLIASYTYERDLLLHCKEKRLRKIVVALDHGEVAVPGYDNITGRVYYLIFHLADGDVRAQVDTHSRLDGLVSLRALKDVTTGLFQVHRQMIAQQDLKPSNVLIFKKEFRVADFGRASRKGSPAVHDELPIAGDRTYAPPEQLYGYVDPDFTRRRIGCDLYMLGNFAAFLFTGINVTAHFLARLDPQFHPMNWAGTYDEVLPYVLTGCGKTPADRE